MSIPPANIKINSLPCHKYPCKMKENTGLYHKQEARVHIPPMRELYPE
uniref:Uncharacterized protein n=1 Tax=Ackermannviridae sp. TaxID=2831612 RepID=A0A8S5VQ92_9CAUD|nr:MAG TPA: hypothetical protein [Ackermannviridae sp.]